MDVSQLLKRGGPHSFDESKAALRDDAENGRVISSEDILKVLRQTPMTENQMRELVNLANVARGENKRLGILDVATSWNEVIIGLNSIGLRLPK